MTWADRQDLPADFALGVLRRREVDVQPAALEFADGLVGEGNFTAVSNLARTGQENTQQRAYGGNEICRGRMWPCRAENTNGGPSKVGGDCERVSKAVAGECERPAAAKRACIRRALVGAAEVRGERNRDWGSYVL